MYLENYMSGQEIIFVFLILAAGLQGYFTLYCEKVYHYAIPISLFVLSVVEAARIPYNGYNAEDSMTS